MMVRPDVTGLVHAHAEESLRALTVLAAGDKADVARAIAVPGRLERALIGRGTDGWLVGALEVTGATQGIGKITAGELVKLGAEVTIVARSEERGRAAAKEIGAELLLADLSLLADVRRLAADFKAKHDKLHVLVNNAGAINQTRKLTAEGLEVTFATNHLAYFLLTHELLPLLEAAGAPGRTAR